MRAPEPQAPMSEDPVAALAADLRVDVGELAFLRDVDAATLADLHAALVDARRRQEQALGEAFEGTIALVPRPLRGRVRRLLVGG